MRYPANETEPRLYSDKRALIVNEETGEPSMGMLLDEMDAAHDIEIHFTRAERRSAVAALIEAFVMAHLFKASDEGDVISRIKIPDWEC